MVSFTYITWLVLFLSQVDSMYDIGIKREDGLSDFDYAQQHIDYIYNKFNFGCQHIQNRVRNIQDFYVERIDNGNKIYKVASRLEGQELKSYVVEIQHLENVQEEYLRSIYQRIQLLYLMRDDNNDAYIQYHSCFIEAKDDQLYILFYFQNFVQGLDFLNNQRQNQCQEFSKKLSPQGRAYNYSYMFENLDKIHQKGYANSRIQPRNIVTIRNFYQGGLYPYNKYIKYWNYSSGKALHDSVTPLQDQPIQYINPLFLIKPRSLSHQKMDRYALILSLLEISASSNQNFDRQLLYSQYLSEMQKYESQDQEQKKQYVEQEFQNLVYELEFLLQINQQDKQIYQELIQKCTNESQEKEQEKVLKKFVIKHFTELKKIEAFLVILLEREFLNQQLDMKFIIEIFKTFYLLNGNANNLIQIILSIYFNFLRFIQFINL